MDRPFERLRGSTALSLVLAACGAAPPRQAAVRCPAGDVVVQVDAEAEGLAGCVEVRGSLGVGPSFSLGSLAGLARIARVAGRLDLSDNIELGGVFLPALVAVEGDVVIENNQQIATASLHRLVRVGGDLVVRDNRGLLRLDLGALRGVGGRIEISGHPELDMVALDRLESAGEFVVEDNPSWPADEVDRLRRALER
jgi:hypothetical protein